MNSSQKQTDWDFGEITSSHYWIDWSKFTDDGTFSVKTSWYTEDGTHMTGFTRVRPSEADYSLWQWLIQQREEGNIKPGIIDNGDLDNFRAKFKASAA